jgi:ParB family chromosome partitioning protein
MNTTPTLEMIDPATLTVDINVRKDAALTAGFIASIKEHGVMEPVIGHRREDGTVHVLMGQRRTRAAVEAGRTSIPVMIIDSPEEAERIVTQVVENIQRAELTEADEADAYHQLSLIGVSAATIAKKPDGPKPPWKAP